MSFVNYLNNTGLCMVNYDLDISIVHAHRPHYLSSLVLAQARAFLCRCSHQTMI